MQTSRLFEIIYLLLNNKSMTAKTLAERFGVSTRTIYRDVDTLSLAGIPIYTEKGKNGGIRLMSNFVLNKTLLNEQEQNEILAALQSLSLVGDGEAKHVLERLSGIFNKTVTNWLEVDFSDWSFSDAFDKLKVAILDKRIIEFDYFSSYGEKTHRRVEPIQLWFKSRAWYFKGFCLLRQDMRLFKLARVSDLVVTDELFDKRDLLATSPSSEEEPNHRPDVTLRLRIAPEMTYRVYEEFCEDIVEVRQDGSFIVTVTWPEDNWVYGFLLSFGEHIEILAPEHMRQIIGNKARKIAKKYLEHS